MKNLNVKITSITVAILLLAFIGKSSYCSHQQTNHSINTLRCKKIVDFALKVAADDELRLRIVANDPKGFYDFMYYNVYDTVSYQTKTIVMRDTAFQFHYNIFNSRKVLQLHQYIYHHDFTPVNLKSLEYSFTKCMKANGLTVERCYLELIDLKRNVVIANDGRPNEKLGNYIESELLTLDLFKSIAVKVYAEISKMSYVSEHFVISSSL